MWSDEAWQAAKPVYQLILAHPFITELASGVLPAAKFRNYIAQDSLYLREYGRVMAFMASRFSDPEISRLFMTFSMENLDAEKALHDFYLSAGGQCAVSDPSVGSMSASPACLLCSSHLWRQAVAEPVEVALASVLPCFTVYAKVGQSVFEAAFPTLESNPYGKWIAAYGGSSFDEPTERLLSLCDEAAAGASRQLRDRMTEAFVMGVKLEWLFWNSAYEMEKWKI